MTQIYIVGENILASLSWEEGKAAPGSHLSNKSFPINIITPGIIVGINASRNLYNLHNTPIPAHWRQAPLYRQHLASPVPIQSTVSKHLKDYSRPPLCRGSIFHWTNDCIFSVYMHICIFSLSLSLSLSLSQPPEPPRPYTPPHLHLFLH